MIQVLFVMEQHLGHRTYFLNMRRFVDADSRCEASWAPVTYSRPFKTLERLLPGIPQSVVGALRGRAEVRQYLRRQDHDVAFFNTQAPGALAGSLVRRRPYVIATDITPRQYDRMGHLYQHEADSPGSLLERFKHRRNRLLFQGAARILPWSSWVRDSLISEYGVTSDRITVLPSGVDLDLWKPATEERKSGPMQVLFVGGDFVRKGGETLLEAFRTLPAGSAELTLVTRSDVAPEPGVRVFRDLNSNDPRLVQIFRDSDVFALPTEAEAFGMVAVEAAASGLPIIATSVGGLSDIVIDGKTGYLVPPADAPALAQRLRMLANDPAIRRRMGHAGRVHAEARFDARRNAATLVSVLQEAVGPVRSECAAEFANPE